MLKIKKEREIEFPRLMFNLYVLKHRFQQQAKQLKPLLMDYRLQEEHHWILFVEFQERLCCYSLQELR